MSKELRPSPFPSQETNEPIDDQQNIYSGFVNILLKAEYSSLEGITLAEAGDRKELQRLLEYVDKLNLPMPVRLVHSVSPERIRQYEEAASKGPYPPLRSLTQYYVLNALEYDGDLEELAMSLAEFTAVEMAYPEEIITEPLTSAANEPLFQQQRYLQAAPIGIDAEWVWADREIFGQNIKFVDLEQNWNLNHPEFAANIPQLEPTGALNPGHEDHGTAVLGIVCAGVNSIAGVGIAPGIDQIWALSHFRQHPVHNQLWTGQVADAIVAILDSGNIVAGDVLLLEVQRGAGVPTETDHHDLDAIRLAVSQEIVVIEAAGNANQNLDTFTRFLSSEQILNPANLNDDFEESGAILVGASAPVLQANQPPSHPRYPLSNYGQRIDCFAWGADVTTIGFDAVGGQRFSGTSAAAAIIAGATILLQSAHHERQGTHLAPDMMRTWLSDPAQGTPSNSAEHMGVMPDLEAIITSRLP